MPITKATASSVAPAAKGDLVVGSATNDAAVLGVGSNDQVLTADSSTATGLKWATAASAVPANDSATVAADESTTSDSFTDLATSGPAVTVTTGTKALVILTCRMLNGTSNRGSAMGFAVSGATTTAADLTKCLQLINDASGYDVPRFSAAYVTTLTAGSNTFTAKYRRLESLGTAEFKDRNIFVINLA